jgi:putative ABC transport system substrate-binding protein
MSSPSVRCLWFAACLSLAVVGVASVTEAQPAAKIPRIGVLVTGPPPAEHVCVKSLRLGLADLGYVEGRTHLLDIRWSAERPEESFPRFGADLVKAGVDVVATVTGQGMVDAKQALTRVPVVLLASTHPVERGLVASMSRPGGNITGLATFTDEMFAKRMQLLTEALPGVTRVAVLRIAGDQNDLVVRDLEMAARRLRVQLQVIQVEKPNDFARAFETAIRGSAQAIMTGQGPFFLQYRREIADLALKHKLPGFSGEPGAADAGMLMTAGASIPASCQRGATFVDRILKGAKPGDLPVEQATTVNLEINLKTARALNLTIPRSLLLRAERVIE